MDSLSSNTDGDPRKLDAFLILPSPSSSSEKLHLHIAITDPVDSGNGILQILLVSITSIPSGEASYDKTCILQPGDHPFITHDSYVAYWRAEIFELEDIKRRLKNFGIRRKERLCAEVGERIIQGVKRSLGTKKHILEFFRQATRKT